jgi:hypothetical protein
LKQGKKARRRILFFATGALWIVLALLVMANATFALLKTTTGVLDNPLAIGNTGVAVNETFNGWNAKQARLSIPTGPGYVNSIVRAMIVPYLYNGSGQLISSDLGAMAAPVGNQMALGDVILEFDSGWSSNWFYEDGFFYYKTVLKPAVGQNQTTLLLNSVRLAAAALTKYEADTQVKVEIIADSLQAEGQAWQEWGVTVSGGVVSP